MKKSDSKGDSFPALTLYNIAPDVKESIDHVNESEIIVGYTSNQLLHEKNPYLRAYKVSTIN